MFGFNKKYSISPEMLRYLNESTNKSLDKYIHNYINNYKTTIPSFNDDPSTYIILFPCIFFISFLAGYNLDKLLKH